jgi:hypothetical protein
VGLAAPNLRRPDDSNFLHKTEIWFINLSEPKSACGAFEKGSISGEIQDRLDFLLGPQGQEIFLFESAATH